MSVRTRSAGPAFGDGSRPRVLSIGGTDPTGGAGIHADLKSFAAHGAYGMAVVTALVAQNTRGVLASHVPDPSFLRAQLEAVSDDVVVDAAKIGMVATAPVAREIARWLDRNRPRFLVLDPVMVATSGHRLLEPDGQDAVRSLLDHADLVTPNLPELAVLLREETAQTWAEALDQGVRLSLRHDLTVLVKGGHLVAIAGRCPDAVVTGERVDELDGVRVRTSATHGTGCSLSAAVTALRPRRQGWTQSVREAKEWLSGALTAGEALRVGRGKGPVDHFHHLGPSTARPFSEEAWSVTTALRRTCDGLEFVRRLADGSLPVEQFVRYLEQDALYLVQYSRVLARASQLAPHRAAQEFFAQGAYRCLTVESELHRRWISRYDTRSPAPTAPAGRAVASRTTAAYTDHLEAIASRGSYGSLLAALLPCYLLYADLGARMLAGIGPEPSRHPFAEWVATYADPQFASEAARARAFTDAAAEGIGAGGRAAMLAAFVRSTEHELAFFAQATARVGRSARVSGEQRYAHGAALGHLLGDLTEAEPRMEGE